MTEQRSGGGVESIAGNAQPGKNELTSQCGGWVGFCRVSQPQTSSLTVAALLSLVYGALAPFSDVNRIRTARRGRHCSRQRNTFVFSMTEVRFDFQNMHCLNSEGDLNESRG